MRNTNKIVIDNLTRLLSPDAPKRVTRNALAGLAGIHYSTLGRKLEGQTSFTLDEVDKIANALELPILELMSEGGVSK